MTLRSFKSTALIAFLGAGCSRPPAQTVEPVANACTVPGVASASRPWRQVRGDGFTFCVPGNWIPADGRPTDVARAWRGGLSTIEWVPGRSGGCSTNEPPLNQLIPPERVVIEGARVELTSCARGSFYTTSASWRDAGFSFVGMAGALGGVDEHFAIYRTVRLTQDHTR